MNIRTTKFDHLTNEEIAAWTVIQQSEPTLCSPFFRPEFTQVVASFRDSVEVAVLEDGGKPVGFFPFERKRRNHGAPVGTRLSDYHGVIAPANVKINPVELLRGCGLSTYRFDHLVDPQSSFARFTLRSAESPYADLSQGFEAYEATLSSGFRSRMRQSRRRIEREIGPLRFESNSHDSEAFATLLKWKISQYQRTKAVNVLGFDWIRELLEQILKRSDPGFSAVMSALYAGERIVAVVYLLRSRQVLHSWFSSYDREVARYSPGMLLKLENLRAAAGYGITHYDFGKGNAFHKEMLRSDTAPLTEGVADLSRIISKARSTLWAVREEVRSTPLRRLVHQPARLLYLIQCWLDLH